MSKYSGWWTREANDGSVRLKIDPGWCYVYSAEELWVSHRPTSLDARQHGYSFILLFLYLVYRP